MPLLFEIKVPSTEFDWSTPVRKPLVSQAAVGRNDPCPCGSGMKAKKCKCRPDKGKPVHFLSDVEFYNAVEAGLVEQYGEFGHTLFVHYMASHVRPYWRDGVITPAFCVDLLVECWERYDKAESLPDRSRPTPEELAAEAGELVATR
jgi:hypothetical protein